MWVCVHGDLGMCRWLRALKNPPTRSVGHSSNKKSPHVGTREFLFVDLEKAITLVFETSPLKRDTWKPKLGCRLWPRALFVSDFCLWGHCLSV